MCTLLYSTLVSLFTFLYLDGSKCWHVMQLWLSMLLGLSHAEEWFPIVRTYFGDNVILPQCKPISPTNNILITSWFLFWIRLTNNILSTGQQVFLRKLVGAKPPTSVDGEDIISAGQALRSSSPPPVLEKKDTRGERYLYIFIMSHQCFLSNFFSSPSEVWLPLNFWCNIKISTFLYGFTDFFYLHIL